MTNDERATLALRLEFIIRASSLIRHSPFVIPALVSGSGFRISNFRYCHDWNA
jgi:hypothetical protein